MILEEGRSSSFAEARHIGATGASMPGGIAEHGRHCMAGFETLSQPESLVRSQRSQQMSVGPADAVAIEADYDGYGGVVGGRQRLKTLSRSR